MTAAGDKARILAAVVTAEAAASLRGPHRTMDEVEPRVAAAEAALTGGDAAGALLGLERIRRELKEAERALVNVSLRAQADSRYEEAWSRFAGIAERMAGVASRAWTPRGADPD